MRTTIDIDDALMRKAMGLSGLTTKKAVVEAALRLLIQTHPRLASAAVEARLNGKGIQTTLVADVTSTLRPLSSRAERCERSEAARSRRTPTHRMQNALTRNCPPRLRKEFCLGRDTIRS